MASSGGSRMEQSCDCCKRYLEHLKGEQQNMTCFLTRMTANYKLSTIVPNRFLRHFTRKIPGTMKLKSPNGCLYDVQVIRRYNKMVLGHGWETFLDIHDIKENDSLLFRHIDEECCFLISIFDSDGCEKILPCAGIKNTPSVGERRVDSVNISSSSDGCEKGSPHRHGKTARMAVTSSSSDVSGKGISSDSESFEWDDLETPVGTNYIHSSRSCLSEAQKESVIAFIQEIQPEVTVFVAIMRKSHVQPPAPFLTITKEYALSHFPHEKTNVTLQRPGSSKKWHPTFYRRHDRGMYMLRGKWLDFVRENHVQEGDICLLYPTMGARKFTFTVRLLRATATDSRRGRVGTGFQVGVSNNAEMGSEVHIKEEPTDGEHVSSENGNHEMYNESLESEDSGGPHQPSYILPFKNHLSRSQQRIVEEKVRAIQSELPIYVAFMWKSNVDDPRHCALEIGSRFAKAVDLPARGQTVVLQYMRKVWKIKMVIMGGRRRLLRGWPKFVHDNGLRVGDLCLFELKKSERKLIMAVDIIFKK